MGLPGTLTYCQLLFASVSSILTFALQHNYYFSLLINYRTAQVSVVISLWMQDQTSSTDLGGKEAGGYLSWVKVLALYLLDLDSS